MEKVLVLYQSLFPHSNVFPRTTGTWDSWETPPGILSTRSVSDNTCLFIALRAWFLGHTGIPMIVFFFLIWWLMSYFLFYFVCIYPPGHVVPSTSCVPVFSALCLPSLLLPHLFHISHVSTALLKVSLHLHLIHSLVWFEYEPVFFPPHSLSVHLLFLFSFPHLSPVSLLFLVVCLSLHPWFVLLFIFGFF